jgi:hypothetical protein
LSKKINEADLMSEKNFEESAESGILKSAKSGPQRMSEFVNSAVSEAAVDRAEVDVKKNEVYVGQAAQGAPNDVFVGATPGATADEVFVGAAAEPMKADPVTQALEELQGSLQRANTAVESVEERQAQIEAVYKKAEQMLEEVTRISEAMTVSSALRDRIKATMTRTKDLRRGVERNTG